MAVQPRYGGAAYGGRTSAVIARGAGAVLVPGFDAAYYVSSRGLGTAAYGRFAYGGRRNLTRPAAGLFAAADPAAGTITIPWWWAFAAAATVARIDPDGTRVPVRGGEGMTPAGPSRRNPSSNPSARDSLEGYTAGTNSTIDRVLDPSIPVTQIGTAVRVTAAAAGTVSVAASLDPVGPLPTVFGFLMRTSAAASAAGVSVTWYDATSTVISTVLYPVSAAARAAAVGAWSWATVLVANPPTGAALGVVAYTASGLPAGGTLDITARISTLPTSLARVNLVPNSSLEVDATGWVNGFVRAGVTATSPATSTTIAAADGNRYGYINFSSPSGTTSGNFDVAVRAGVSPVDPAITYRAAVALNCATAAIGYGRLGVDWLDANGVQLSSNGAVTSAVAQLASTGWTTFALDVTPPAGAVYGRLFVWFTNTENATTARSFRWDAAVLEDRNTYLAGSSSFVESVAGAGDLITADSYFDGDFLGAAWLGSSGLSYSALGQVNTLVDAEAPLDQPVTYELTSPAVPGWVARSEAVTLASADVFAIDPNVPVSVADWGAKRRALLTHPGQARTIGVWVEKAPKTKNAIERTAHKVPGRRNKVVYSADEYDGDEGELTFVCETADERRRLRQLLDGSPLLLRSPAEYGYPPVWWLSFADIDTEPLIDDARNPVRKLTVPFDEVDRPAVATRALAVA